MFLVSVSISGSVTAQTSSGQSHPFQSKNASVGSLVSYHEQVEAYLKAACEGCHGGDKKSGGLTLDTPAGLFKGGSSTGSKLVVAGSSSSSLILQYLSGKRQPQMPMGAVPATPAQIQMIAHWIDQGAHIDGIKPVWPYTLPAASALPAVKNKAWVQNPVDRFILAKLEAHSLKPAPAAPRVTLMRRVYADLIGEPPTPDEAVSFVSDRSPQAYEKLVDKLLADPRYGERWGRHWLDLVRYADTHGFENDGSRPRAWRYRDFVIDSFNADKPYDRFIKEQIAGDELYPQDNAAIIATGYARLSPWDELSTDHPQRWQDYLNDVVDTTGAVMLGMTVGCARCHNHKYDRITMNDYYGLQAFFVGTRMDDRRLQGEDHFAVQFAGDRSKLEKLRKDLKEFRERFRSAAEAEKRSKSKAGETVRVDDGDLDRAMPDADRNHKDQIEGEINSLQSKLAPYEPVAEIVTDSGRTAPAQHLLLRGNLTTPGPEVQPSFITSMCADGVKPVISPPVGMESTGRRTALANWIASRDNPLTARVMVNRIWQHHFGAGIVGTPSDFGKNGDKATHPELLDWLSVRFMADGWSMKKLHKLMLMSATYQQSTQFDTVSYKADPGNRLYWRMNRIRLEGEALRDTILATSGRLNPAMAGPGVYPKVSDEVLSTGSTHKWGNSSEEDANRRTVYVFQRRSLVLPIVEAYDAADMNNTCPRRSVTTIAPQALSLFNGDFSRTESKFIAARVTHDAGSDPVKQIERAYVLTLLRQPTGNQKQLAAAFIEKQTALRLGQGGVRTAVAAGKDQAAIAKAHEDALAEFCHVLINTNEFIYLD